MDPFAQISQCLSEIGALCQMPAPQTSETNPQDQATCADGVRVAADALHVTIAYYDPLAADGMYRAWGTAPAEAEEAAAGIVCAVGDERKTSSDEGTIVFNGLNPAEPVELSFPDFRTSGAGRAYLSAHTDCGEVMTAEADQPAARQSFRVRPGSAVKIRIWLRPNTIVLHWTAGARRLSSGTRRLYHFMIDGEARWVQGGNPEGDSRFWRHNLYIHGTDTVSGCNNVDLPIGRALGGQRGEYASWNDDRTEVVVRDTRGYGMHAGGFNTGSVGVSICAMSGSADNGTINEDTAVTHAQAQTLIAEVARLCRAWRIDATDPNQVCTHFEVEYLHRGNSARKWDITWLPVEMQDAYRDANNRRELCARRDDPYQHVRRVDFELDETFAEGRNTTDRVSAYLRERIAARMTAGG